jgi:hypothetical protein
MTMRIITVYSSLQYKLSPFSQLCSRQSSDNCFHWRMFPLLYVPLVLRSPGLTVLQPRQLSGNSSATTGALCRMKSQESVLFANWNEMKSNLSNVSVKVSYGRRSVGQPIFLWGHHLGPATNFSFSFKEIIFKYLWIFGGYGLLSLTRRWVCNLLIQVPLGFARGATLGSRSRWIWDHSLLSHLRLGPLSVVSYDSQGYGWGILTHLHTGFNTCPIGLHTIITPWQGPVRKQLLCFCIVGRSLLQILPSNGRCIITPWVVMSSNGSVSQNEESLIPS